MKRFFFVPFILLLLSASPEPRLHWPRAQLDRLIYWAEEGAKEGLEIGTLNVPALRGSLSHPTEPQALGILASASAVRLLKAYREGCCNLPLRADWHMAGEVWPNPTLAINEAVRNDRLDQLFQHARPSHPFYRALAQAYGTEKDPSKRAILAANMDRWRWMPRDLGQRYLLVNAAAYEASLWEKGSLAGRWAVIVGKTKSPTPVFRARVTGVTFNPWWEIPASIAAENIATLVARHPADAARKGYVLENGRYRQRPGPDNALGRMKLVMPNAFNVYLHDTPAQALFSQDVRAYSHGCVRVGDALGLATALLAPQLSRGDVDARVDTGVTLMVTLDAPIPVYVTYFTAEPDDLGGIRYFPDIYRRDQAALAPNSEGVCGR